MTTALLPPPRPSRTCRVLSALLRFWRSATMRFLLLGAVVALVLLHLWGPRLSDHAHASPQFGDLSGWAQSLGSFAAVVVALVQARQLQVNRLEEVRRQEVHERTQVYGWVAYQDHGHGDGGWYVSFNNATHAPIGVWVLRIRELDAPQTEILALDVTQWQPILPGLAHHRLDVSAGDLLRPAPELEFADCGGRCWRRDWVGNLVEIEAICLGDQVLARNPRAVTGRITELETGAQR